VRALRACTLVVVAIALAACGGGEEPEDVVDETASKLGEIRSGTMEMSLLVAPHGEGGESGFELRGPFSLGEPGELPVLRIAYTQVTNGERGTVTLVSTGRDAYAVVRGRAYRLSAEQTEELRSTTRMLGDGGLPDLPLADWIIDATMDGDGRLAGVETRHVRARLDIVETVNGLLGIARGLGRDVPRVDGQAARALRRATRSTLFDMHAGKKDGLLRRVRVEADFALDVPDQLRGALGELVGGRVAFRFGIARPNEPVTVTAPADVRPASELG
jgi:hypothetical protein